MSKTVVYNNLVDSTGLPLKNVKISASIVRSAFAGPELEVYENANTVTNALGHWELELTPNLEVTPPHTYYVIQEGGKSTWYCIIPISSTPVTLNSTIVADGKNGPPLLKGDKGPTGDKGATGDAIQILIPDPDHPSFYKVGIVSNDPSVVLTKGDKGDPGAQGPPGPAGTGSAGGDIITDTDHDGIFDIINPGAIIPDGSNEGLFIIVGEAV